jgi:hypothetical protein
LAVLCTPHEKIITSQLKTHFVNVVSIWQWATYRSEQQFSFIKNAKSRTRTRLTEEKFKRTATTEINLNIENNETKAVPNISLLTDYDKENYQVIVTLGGVVVSVLATGPKVAGSNPAEDDGF